MNRLVYWVYRPNILTVPTSIYIRERAEGPIKKRIKKWSERQREMKP